MKTSVTDAVGLQRCSLILPIAKQDKDTSPAQLMLACCFADASTTVFVEVNQPEGRISDTKIVNIFCRDPRLSSLYPCRLTGFVLSNPGLGFVPKGSFNEKHPVSVWLLCLKHRLDQPIIESTMQFYCFGANDVIVHTYTCLLDLDDLGRAPIHLLSKKS